MFRYSLRRILQMIPTVIGVILLTFILFNIVPNDLAAIALGKNVTPEMLEDFDERRGLNRPLFFGRAASTRAYSDHHFEEGAGRWRDNSISYDRDQCMITLKSGSQYNPLSFELKSTDRYVWCGVYTGSGSIGGYALSSKEWAPFEIEMNGDEAGLFESINQLAFKKISSFFKLYLYFFKIINFPIVDYVFLTERHWLIASGC